MRKIKSWFLPILMLLSIFFINLDSRAFAGENDDYLLFPIPDSQEVAKCLQDRNFLGQINEAQAQRIKNLEQEKELLIKESELKDKIIAIVEREVESTRRALEDMKGVADRALKLAEIGKKSPLQEVLEWVIRIAIFVGAYMLAK